jgi:hypothetical protein
MSAAPPQGPGADDAAVPRRTPRARLLVAAGVALESVLLAGVAVSVAATSVTGSAQDRLGAAVLAVTALALAAGLGAVAVGVRRGAAWSRSPALVWQVIQAAVGALDLPPAVGVPLVVLALAVGYGVLRADVVPPRRAITPPR